jgi:hypothetical protein
VRARLRGHCFEAAWLAVPGRPIGASAKYQEPGRASSRRGLAMKSALARRIAESLSSVNKAINGLPEVDKLVALATSHVNAEYEQVQ